MQYAMKWVYLLWMGEFNFNDDGREQDAYSLYYIGWALFIAATIFLFVIMLNLLVAIYGSVTGKFFLIKHYEAKRSLASLVQDTYGIFKTNGYSKEYLEKRNIDISLLFYARQKDSKVGSEEIAFS